MGWLGWLRRSRTVTEDRRLQDWRREWDHAAAAPAQAAAEALRARLDEIAATLGDDDVEVEREMQAALDDAVELSLELQRGTPPVIRTGHRAAGADACHFSAPASRPDDPGQPAGTLLLTATRGVFVGGARAVAAPWHAVARVERLDRDLVLVRRDAADLMRLRLNTYGDALRAMVLAGHLARHFARRGQI